MNSHRVYSLAFVLSCYGLLASAQEQFELVAPELRLSSRAILTDAVLQVVGSDGVATNYQRESRFDSQDGAWLGYYSPSARQVLRWPRAGTGNMQIGSIQGSSIAYRTSRMSIRAVEQKRGDVRTMQRPILPPQGADLRNDALKGLKRSDLFGVLGGGVTNKQPTAESLLIASYDPSGSPWILSRSAGSALSCVPTPASSGTDWWVTPAGGGYVRLQNYTGGRVFAVSGMRGNEVGMQPLSQDARQLWRIVAGRRPHQFALANAFHGGQCLTHLGGGRLGLQPISFASTQLWISYVPPTLVAPQPFWRSVSQEIHANPQLPPAQLELKNTQRYALIVLLGDARKSGFETIRVGPGDSTTVSLDRDAGATMIESVEIRSPVGLWDRQELVTAIPPSAFFDLSVYEEHLQSIAIDRTGKSPNPIEDVNYVPKSIGWLPLPAGAALPQRGQIDLYARAKSANNPGAVRRMDPKQFDDPPEERPLESILNQIQSVPRKSF